MTTRTQFVAAVFALLGMALVLGSNLTAGAPSAFVVGVTLWGFTPYVVLWAASRLKRLRDPWIFVGAGAIALAAEAGLRASIFLFAKHSTAAMGLLFSPGLILAVALPIGAIAGKLLGNAWRGSSAALRAASAVTFGAALALLCVGLSRPDLLPTAQASRRAALRTIGEPRVILGEDAFRKVLVSGVPGWHLTGEFDGRSGDEIAVIGEHGADLYNAENLAPKGRFGFGPDVRWNWFSTLIRMEGRVVLVQTGGGFSDTEVRELDGKLLWNYHPDEKLPPTSLLPADLDGNGPAFYATTGNAFLRLDKDGAAVWSRPARSPQILALTPRTKSSSAWIVTREFGGGAKIWDENGVILGQIPLSIREDPVAVVDWPTARELVIGRTTARIVGLDGKSTFEYPFPPMHLISAESLRASASDKPLLALLAAGPTGVPRWRLLLIDAAGNPVYDEVFGAPLRLIKARLANDREMLLLSSADGLRALR